MELAEFKRAARDPAVSDEELLEYFKHLEDLEPEQVKEVTACLEKHRVDFLNRVACDIF